MGSSQGGRGTRPQSRPEGARWGSAEDGGRPGRSSFPGRPSRPSKPRYRNEARRQVLAGLGLVVGVAVAAGAVLGVDADDTPAPTEVASPAPTGAPVGPASVDAAGSTAASNARPATLADDPRVRAFLEGYGSLIDSVSYAEADAIFFFGTTPIHFMDGRMVRGDRLASAEACDPIFYPYSLEPLRETPPPPSDDLPSYCTHVAETLWGRSETEIRRHGRSVRFLDHRMFVNAFTVEPLAAVERDLRAAARTDREVAAWIDELEITYSFISRDIAGSDTQSQHGFGLAVDFVPTSYEGRAVYWRWSRALDREGWFRIPVEDRWSPPAAVVITFERHGFVWGGKWTRFDAMHFEYRPEIIAYSRLVGTAP